MTADAATLVAHLRGMANPDNVAGMARFGINTERALGISMVRLRALAKTLPKNHALAAELWETGIHEACILATLVDEKALVTPAQMDRWVLDFNSWDLCDQTCQNLFRVTPFAFQKATEWARREPDFVRRAGFVLMAGLAVKAKKVPDSEFEQFFPLVSEYAHDGRNFVKKSVNWALRQIGKRSPALRVRAIAAAEEIARQSARSAHWIAADALRELRAPLRSASPFWR